MKMVVVGRLQVNANLIKKMKKMKMHKMMKMMMMEVRTKVRMKVKTIMIRTQIIPLMILVHRLMAKPTKQKNGCYETC